MKVTTWLLAIHNEREKQGPQLIKVFGNMYDVEGFIIKKIKEAKKKYNDCKLNTRLSTTKLEKFEETDDGVIRGRACFEDFGIFYSAYDEHDVEYVEIIE